VSLCKAACAGTSSLTRDECARAQYAVNDNSFTLTDYSNWAIAVNEDQGHMLDTHAGVGSTTGDWQHVAVRRCHSAGSVRACWRLRAHAHLRR
jgi:hypothetical protein